MKTNSIPKMIPPVPLLVRPKFSIPLAGLLPFTAIAIEYYFIFTSIWFHKVYYMFGFPLIIFLITVIVCAETSIICCYFMLCAEDYHWWWRSFLVSGSAAVYAFVTSGLIFAKNMPMTGLTNSLIYILWTLGICFTLFLALGTIGFLASFMFIITIYNRLRIE